MKFYTLGVYGTAEAEFFQKLRDSKIDTFCDIRQRRAVRGSTYAFVNAVKLQTKLAKLGINYEYVKALAAPAEIRNLQKRIDAKTGTGQRQRERVSPEFIAAYNKTVLKPFDFNQLLSRLKTLKAQRIAIFCVEQSPAACHRSLVAKQLHARYGYPVVHL
jgi:uncharacterized protein (DUF488 family)